ncbi:MAG: hypothetical protein QXF24_08500 [Thermoproteota archaeon]
MASHGGVYGLRVRRRPLLNDLKGVSNAASAAALSIIAMLVYFGIMNSQGGAEKLFIAIFGFLKFLGLDFDPEGVVNSPLGQVAAYVGSFVGMVLLAVLTFAGTQVALGLGTTIRWWVGEGRGGRNGRASKKPTGG